MRVITIHQRYRRTDGQTTYHGNTALHYASCGKNNCRDPEMTVIHVWLPGVVCRRPQSAASAAPMAAVATAAVATAAVAMAAAACSSRRCCCRV